MPENHVFSRRIHNRGVPSHTTMPSSTPHQEWRRIAAENQKKPRFGLAETLQRIQSNERALTHVELAGWTHLAAAALTDSLRHNHYLTRMSLQACQLGDNGLALLCPALLQGNPPLQYLDLSGNGITDSGAVVLGRAIQHHPTLCELVLAWNGIADMGATALAVVVKTSLALHILDLSGVSEGRGGGSRDSFLRTENMQTVCHLGNVGCASLAEALPFSKLVTLTLSRQHRITATGIQALSRGLQNCQHLKHLELQRIPVDDDGAVALAGALGSSSLLTLELTISKISDRGAKALAHSLASSRTPRLESLGLTQNAIGLEGLEALEAAASVNMTLQRLELYGHAAGKAGSTHVWKIKPWLRMNRSSRQLLKCYCDKEHLLAHFVARVSKLPDPTRLFRVLLEIPLVFERSGCSNRIN